MHRAAQTEVIGNVHVRQTEVGLDSRMCFQAVSIILGIAAFGLTAGQHGERAEQRLERPVTLSASNEELRSLLKRLFAQLGVLYRLEQVGQARVTANFTRLCGRRGLEAILRTASPGCHRLAYRLEKGVVVIRPAGVRPPSPGMRGPSRKAR